MVYTANDPGNWAIWKTKKENKSLPLQEQTQKYRKEKLLFESQYMDFVQQQQAIQQQRAQTGGTSLNGVKSVAFDAEPIFKTNSASTQTLKVKFSKPVIVNTSAGTPSVTVNNDQLGGGTADKFGYDFSAGSGTDELTFTYSNPLAVVTAQLFSANIIATGIDLVGIEGSGTGNPTGTPVANTYTFASDTNYTTSGLGETLGMSVVINASLAIESVTTTIAGKEFVPGEIITFANGQLGAGSIGGTITIGAGALTADKVRFLPGATVDLNGGTISTGDGSFNTILQNIARRQGTPALDFASTSTKTGDPS
tara:strand:- start:413 stop:1342 length:930 start_codon:yes stop_codon:yes gene_type:complete